jgi:hypothetical protein
MNTKKIIFKILTAVVITLAITGCSINLDTASQGTTAPTLDMGTVHTQVAQTVVAQMTVEAALHPSATPEIKSTSTPFPTATLMPSLEAPTLVTPTVKISSGGGGGWVVYPTKTKTPYTDSCQLTYTSPSDYKKMEAGLDFDAKWTLKNTGKRDWNTQFYIAKVRGDLGKDDSIAFLSYDVVQLDSYTYTVDMVAPKDSGTYQGVYKLVNDDGVAICQFYVVITVK